MVELVHRGGNELVSRGGDAITEGFKVFRMPRSDRGVARGPRSVKPAKVKVKSKRAPGRPPLYNGNHRRIIAAAIKQHGYTKGLEFLRKERKLDISMTVARSVAEQFSIKLRRGRPKAA